MSWISERMAGLKTVVSTEKQNLLKKVSSVCIHGEDDCIRCAAEDFNQPDGDPVWQSLEEDDLKRVIYMLPEPVRDMMRRHPGKVVLAGGFIRALIANEEVHDIDLFVNTKQEAIKWADEVKLDYSEGDMNLTVYPDAEEEIDNEIQIVYRYPFKESYEVPDQFDYTVVKAAVWFSEEIGPKKESGFVSICHERFYRDIARKALVYGSERQVERIASLPRLLKYVKYGYSIDPQNLAQVVVRTCLSMDFEKGFDGAVKQLTDFYQPGGQKEDWADLNKKFAKPKPKKKKKKPVAQARSNDYSFGS